MSNSHKGDLLQLSGSIIPVDTNTTFLAHYDITENDVLFGVTPSAGAVFTLRPLEGKYGGGIAIEEGTTNLSNVTSTSTWDNTGHSIFTSNDNRVGNPFIGIPVYSLQSLSGNSEFGIGTANVTGNGYYSASVWAYFDTATGENGNFPTIREYYASSNTMKQQLYYYDANGNAIGSYASVPKRQWVNLKYENWLTTSGTAQIVISSYINVSGSTLYMTAPQIENKPFSTSFVNGTRANGNIVYPNNGTLNPKEGCINLWVNVRDNLPTYGWRMIFVVRDGGITGNENNEIRMGFVGNCTTWHWKTTGSGGNAFYQTQAVTSGWHMFTINWSTPNSYVKFYYDGNLMFTGTSTTYIPSSFYNYFYLGNWSGAGSDPSDHIIDELRIDKIARTDDEIKSWYISNQPFYPKGIYRLAY